MNRHAEIRPSQLFGWESEPKTERASTAKAPPEARTPTAMTRPEGATDWKSQRATPSRHDEVLSSGANAWSQGLPSADRPANLCARYPRLANRLALCWPDAVLTQRLLDSLLVDKRGKRQGFPAAVAEELIRLRKKRSLSSSHQP